MTTTTYSQGEDGITTYIQKTVGSGGINISFVAQILSLKTWKTDINGNVIEETLGKKSVKTEYNSLGFESKSVAEVDRNAEKLTDSVTLKWTYDAQGNVRYEYDGNGFKTEYHYDELGRLVNTIKRYGEGNVSEDKMTYDLDGNLTEETTVLNNVQINKKSYVYDDLGRVVQSQLNNPIC